jgi:hypothetical protein
MSTLELTASGTIPGNSCVKVVGVNQVGVCTASNDIVVGVTDYSQKQSGETVTLQDSSNEFFLLRAGGTIAAGDYLVPTTNGSVVSASTGTFISTETAASGETLWAKRVSSVKFGTVGIYGAIQVASWIRDSVLETQSLDCLWIGDSNTGFNGWGWADAWQHGLCQNGAPMYGSMIWVPYNPQPNLGYRSNVFSSFSAATGVVAGTGGSSGASAALKATFSVGSGSLTVQGTAGTVPDFADVPSSRTASSETALWLYMRNIQTGTAAGLEATFAEPMPIGLNEALIFRAQVNLRNSGSQKFTTRWANVYNNQGLGALGNPTQSTTTVSGSADSWDTYTHTLAVDSTRFLYPSATNIQGQYGVKVALDGSGFGGGNALKEGTSLGLCSVYRAIKGTSSSIMEYRGSATLTQLATDINQAKTGFCTTLLKEARERQIAAGGSGRVLICIQGGVNSGDWSPSNPAAAITAVESIKTDIKSAWANLGYPAADLLFLFMVSHPIDAGDASLTVLRTYAQNYYANSNDTLFVNLNDIAPFTTITTNNWYDSAGTAHLDEATRGYEAISSRIVSNILRYAP